jgi:hypothetical protein
MLPYVTIAMPRYYIRGMKGEHFDVFNKKTNAIKEAVALAIEYPGNTFLVVKKVYSKETTVFSFKFEAQFKLEDIKDVYNGVIDSCQKKLKKTRFWREPDGTDT